jgi:hypothetical protein
MHLNIVETYLILSLIFFAFCSSINEDGPHGPVDEIIS